MERTTLFWSGWRRAPMLRIAMPFAAGLLLGRMVWPDPPLPALVVMGVLALLLVAVPALARLPFRHRWTPYAAAVPALVLAGLCWWGLRTADRHAPNDPDATHLVEVDQVHGASDRYLRCDARLLRSWTGAGEFQPNALCLLTIGTDSMAPSLRPGDRLLMRAGLSPIARTPDPGGFDVRAWAGDRGIRDQGFVEAGHWRLLGHRWRWTDLFAPAQQQVWQWLKDSGLGDRERAVVLALLLGLRNELDADQKDAFARSGTMHVLAVSGMHVALIYWVLLALLRPLGRSAPARWVRAVIVIVLLWAYAGITGGTPSVLRATVMCSLFVVATLLERRSSSLNTLMGAALLLLLLDPRMLFQLSFQLSFLAVLGIVLCYVPLRRLWSPSNVVLRYCWSLVAVSLAAQLFTTPLSLAVFQAFPVWFLPANLVIVTLVNLGVVGGLLLLVALPVPVLGPLIARALGWLVQLIGGAGELFAHAPCAYPDVRIGAGQAALLLLLVLAVCLDRLGGQKLGRWLALATLSVFLISVVAQVRRSTTTRELVVFDERAGLVMALREGPAAVVLESTEGLADTRQRIERFTRATGAAVRDTLTAERLLAGAPLRAGFTRGGAGAWSGAGIDLLLVAGETPPPGPPVFQVLVLTGAAEQAAEAALARLRPDGHVVLAATLDGLTRWRLRERCAALGLACHDVRRDGAFVLPVRRTG
ncbi:MAG: ComEC/Rec2 family competence protein [Flavobacteriales bacterium]|nr:ComEC/Rec2 family competence protein [Flavobacteriales bacterium]